MSDEEKIKEIEDESRGQEWMKMVEPRNTETEKEEMEDGKSYDVCMYVYCQLVIDVHIFFMITIMFMLNSLYVLILTG